MISAQAIAQHIMNSLKLGETLARTGKTILAHVAGAFVLMTVGLLLVIFAVGYGSWSGYLAALTVTSSAKAALIVAVGLLVLAAGFFIGGWRFIQYEPKRRVKPPKHPPAPAPGIGGLPFAIEDAELVIKLLKDRVEEDPLAATLVSALSGYVAGAVLFNRK